MKKYIASTLGSLSFFAPVITFAQTAATTGANGPVKDATSLAKRIIDLGNIFVYILISIAVIYLIWGIVWYLIAGGEEAKAKGSSIITRGVIGLVVIFSIWGLVALVIRVVGISSNTQDINGQVPTNIEKSPLGTVPQVTR